MDHLTIGVGVLRVIKGDRLNPLVALKEWIDNALGAKARSIIVRRTGETLEIIDDGEGCEDLIVMESIAKSCKKSHNKASMYGIGGVMSQIRASIDGRVEVTSVHRNATSGIAIDWDDCIEKDRFEAKSFNTWATVPGTPTGTTIRIPKAKRFYKLDQLVADIGHAYAGELKRGKRIAFETDGVRTEAKPFGSPPFIRKVEFGFDFQGHAIEGFCGVVKPGVANPYPGWSVHWGYRVAMVTKAPAGDHLFNRIYGEVRLPQGWKNINPTKDDFTNEADDLWEKIGEACADVIKLADEQSTDLELSGASTLAGDLLTQAVIGDKIKGRRPGTADKKGTAKATGRGAKHREFTTWQPGDSPSDKGNVGLPTNAPSRIRIGWDPTMEHAYRIDETGTRNNRTMAITLNQSMRQILDFKDDPARLATLCCAFIARELTSIQKYDLMFPEFKDREYHEVHDLLLSRVSVATSATSAA